MTDETIIKAIEDTIKKYSLVIENLTERQMAEAILQACKAGDFKRLVTVDGRKQTIVYIPYAELEWVKMDRDEWKRKYEELKND